MKLESKGLETERDRRLWQALNTWRSRTAQAEGVTPHTICPDDSLLDLVRNTPEEAADLNGIYGLGAVRIGKFGNDILAVCKPFSDGLSNEAKHKRRLMRALMQWCAATAETEGEPEHTVFSKITLRAIAAKQPQTLAELSGIHGVDTDKIEKYGEAVLEVCRRFDNP